MIKFRETIKENTYHLQMIAELSGEDISNDYYCGYRQESPFPLIKLLKTNDLWFDYKPHLLGHPDIIALLCMISYYAFFCNLVSKDTIIIEFPRPISVNCAKAIETIYYYDPTNKNTKSKKIIINNVSSSIISYGEWIKLNKVTGDKPKIGISFGGGLDSMAAHYLFPKAYLIHEKNYKNMDYTHTMIYNKKYGKKAYSIESNNKELCTMHGWSSWISCVSTSLLLSSDLKLEYIFLGSSLGSVYLNNGRKFFNAHEKPYVNHWYKIFHEVGIPILTPMAGFSDLLLAKIIPRNVLLTQLNYCTFGIDGRNCHKCWKCFRRDMIISYITGKPIINNIANIVNMDNINNINNINNIILLYETNETVRRLMEKYIMEPINENKMPSIGPTLIYILMQVDCRENIKKIYPVWIHKYAKAVNTHIRAMGGLDLDFIKLFYDKSTKLFEQYNIDIKKIINRKLSFIMKQISPMVSKDYSNLENWGNS